jgi:hypothetical protein
MPLTTLQGATTQVGLCFNWIWLCFVPMSQLVILLPELEEVV